MTLGNAVKQQARVQDGFSPHGEPLYALKERLLSSPTVDDIIVYASRCYFCSKTMDSISMLAMSAGNIEFLRSNKDRISGEIALSKFKLWMYQKEINLPREDVERGEYLDVMNAILKLFTDNLESAIRDESGDNTFKMQYEERTSTKQTANISENTVARQGMIGADMNVRQGFHIPALS